MPNPFPYSFTTSNNVTPLQSYNTLGEILAYLNSLLFMLQNQNGHGLKELPTDCDVVLRFGELCRVLIDDAYGHLENIKTGLRS